MLPPDFQLIHSNPKLSPGRYHVLHKKSGIDVYIAEDDLTQAEEELPLHARVPTVWEAYLSIPPELRSSRPADWMWGFQEARRQALPKKGKFTSIDSLTPAWCCQHPDQATASAREIGFLAYFFYIEAQRTVTPARAA